MPVPRLLGACGDVRIAAGARQAKMKIEKGRKSAMPRPKRSRPTPALWAILGCASIVIAGPTLLYAILSHRWFGGSPALGASAPVSSPVSGADAPPIRVEVTLAPSLRTRAAPAASLYVFVRDAARGGPALAVMRLTSRFPQTVELSSADTMIPGHSIRAGERVQVVARVSPSGDPMDEAGDLSGHADYRVGRRGAVDVVIDRVTP